MDKAGHKSQIFHNKWVGVDVAELSDGWWNHWSKSKIEPNDHYKNVELGLNSILEGLKPKNFLNNR